MIALAMDYVASFFPNERFVSIGGSIARGTADQYSDVDLTIYNHLKVTDDQNVEYRDIIIQIHFSSLPRIRSVCKDPWANRFLSEIRVLRDKDNLLRNIHQEACTFLNSSSAQKKMIYTVQEIVQHRILAAKRFYQIGRFYSATNAAMGSWSEAAFLYLYLAVSDLERAEAFYDQLLPLLGFDLKDKEKDAVLESEYKIVEYHHKAFSLGFVSPRSVYKEEKVSRRKPGALHHLAFQVGLRAEVDRLFAEIKKMRINIVHFPRFYPEYCKDYYAFFFKDSEGIEYEIVSFNRSAYFVL
ncbi:VOC family protein [Sporolactobacillus sp. CPB3-1]|uniref:VOC family protein n=1 Tax=Sporolactobacillus mangiferae TaxID=2940498 RepID=A0ABT0MAR5_9BACL|nr:VOC family protein [Sporolactobacillus mangiferae]MCL1631965.1 VOC family protein [Sporolactobacillus mangiferae]